MTSVLVHYSEVALKGKNRSWFIGRLVRNLHGALAGLRVKEVRTPIGRIEIVLNDAATMPEVLERLSRVFGVANYSEAVHVPRDFEGMASAIVAQLPPRESVASFRVLVRRADQKFTTPSPELAKELGSRVWQARGWKVDLDHADLVIRVEIIPGGAYCHMGRRQGPGGLPSGTGGRLVALLSGGIDSPVAAWRMMRRGCNVTLVHFHSAPFLSNTSQEKARRLAEVLTMYQLRTRLYLVPFGELQRQVTMSVPGDLRVIVYRRMMLRIAQRIARDVRAKALITGDVIGQVASQTLDNMTTIDRASQLTILRPLVGMDKEEIIATAQRLGTYEISIVPDQDSCTLFTPRHPETHARRHTIDDVERTLPVDEMIATAVRDAAVEQLSYPVIK
ncbi:MAG TPA: tRNA uracil 4-sulfurtransferase ThiI [Vicinamibacterales bacterium]|nr:tRNA uracil 4-sulfurtransferase ThiI [Vicinamibacterales bacterium]